MPPPEFAAGEAVEVGRDDSWFEARIVRSISGHPSRYSVSFRDGAVTEIVAAASVRPLPDRGRGSATGFRRHHLVDAFVDGGWRVGVVLEKRREGRYLVCFPERREEMEFGSVEMREHFDWVDGKWVSAQEEGATDTMYVMGTRVEVARVSKKLPVAWYTAIVIKIVGKNILLVEYESLRKDDGALLREIVASQYVRPCPPHTSKLRFFNLLDEVEAFYSNGWWPGVVAKVHGGSRYNVKFMHWEEEIEFSHAELRLLYDWVDGRWVLASQDKFTKSQNICGTKSVGHEHLLHATATSCRSKAPCLVMNSSASDDEAVCEFPINATNSETKDFGRLASQSPSKVLQPCKKRKGDTIEDSTRLLDFLVKAKNTKNSSMVNAGFDVTTPIIEGESNFRIKALVEKCCSTNPFKEMNVGSPDTVIKQSENTLSVEINNKLLVPEKLRQESNSVYQPLGMSELADKRQPSKAGAERSGTSGFLRTIELQQTEGACPMVNDELQGGKIHHDNGERQNASRERRRKRGRPKKLRVTGKMVSLQGDSMVSLHDKEIVFEPQLEDHSMSRSAAIAQCDACTNGMEAEIMEGSLDASMVETSISGVQLSEAGSEAHIEVLSGVGGKLAKQTFTEKTKEAVDKPPIEQCSLLFEKCSSVWDSIESMEIFSVIPQKPHFRPLEQYCKDFREGMAIGLMVTFSNLVSSIGRLRVIDSRSEFDERMRTLMHLEGYGFDVQCIRARLMGLLRMKDKQEQLADERSAMEVLILQKKKEKDLMNAEIESIEKVATELEQSISHFHEKKRDTLKQKRENDMKLANLRMDSKAAEDALIHAEHEFEATISAAW